MSLGARATRGKRVTPLTSAEIATNDEFWGDLLKEDVEDPDFDDHGADEDDDDDVSDVTEDELSSENEDDIKIDKEKIKDKQKKVLYKDPLKKGKKTTTSKSNKPSFLKAIDGEADEEDEEIDQPVERPTKRKKASPTSTSTPTTPPSPTTTRKSLRPSVQASIERNNDFLYTESKKKVTTPKKKKVTKEKEMTQEELIEEAMKTEVINQDSLNNYLQREEDRKKSQAVKKQVITGPRIIYKSNEEGTSVTFTDDYLPDCLDEIKQQDDLDALKDLSDKVKILNVCVITGQPAKYTDPVTKQSFANIEAYQALKLKTRQQQHQLNNNNNNNNWSSPSISASTTPLLQGGDDKKRAVKKKVIPVISSSTPDMIPRY